MFLPLRSDLRRLVRLAALRFGGWPRRVLVIACLLLAALSAVSAAQPAAAGKQVVVAARDLAAGRAITAADVRVARWPAAQVPHRGLTSMHDAIGSRPATAVTAGEPLTVARLIGVGLTVGLPAGEVVVTVGLAESPAVSLIHTGDRVDLLRGASSPDMPPTTSAATVVARDVPVLAVIPADQEAGVSAGLAVAVDDRTALRLAGQSGVALIATLRPQ